MGKRSEASEIPVEAYAEQTAVFLLKMGSRSDSAPPCKVFLASDEPRRVRPAFEAALRRQLQKVAPPELCGGSLKIVSRENDNQLGPQARAGGSADARDAYWSHDEAFLAPLTDVEL